jgi:peptide/nickel transport system permease protein
MIAFIVRRILQMVPLLIALSVLIFAIIQLPPGDFVTTRINQLRVAGVEMEGAQIQRLVSMYNLDKPLYEQYLLWIKGILLEGDLGRSMESERRVNDVIGDRLALTMVVSLLSLAFTWALAVPVGIVAATRQYSIFDYAASFIGFIGISVPGFLIALIILYSVFARTGVALTGLFSPEYVGAAWSFGKVIDLFKHVWLPMVVIGISGTAGLIRVTRGMMLDELGKQYVITARAKGLPEGQLLFKYPVRLAINPLISTIGWLLPSLISGEALVSIVLNLPTMGPLLLRAVMVQDMPLAGSFLLITSTLTVIGTLLSDILLAWLDPRIRFGSVVEES